MSFNIRYDNGKPRDEPNAWVSSSGGPGRRERALRVVQDFDPDLLGVQEALRNQLEDLRGLLKAHAMYGVGRDDGKTKGEHCAVFYRTARFEPLEQGTFWLTATPETPGSRFPGAGCTRIASWLRLKDRQAGQILFVLNTHWDHVSQAANEHAAKLVRERIKQLASGLPLIVMGDLNVQEDNVALAELVGANDAAGPPLRDSFRSASATSQPAEATYHDFKGGPRGRRIDFILHSDALRTEAADIVRTQFNGRYPSDHFPITAVLNFAN